MTSILMSHWMVTKTPQNVHRKYFCMTFTCDIKIDVNMCERHYVNLVGVFFVNLLHSPAIDCLTSFWRFDILTHYLITSAHHRAIFDIWNPFDNLTYFWYFDTWLKPPEPITELEIFIKCVDQFWWWLYVTSKFTLLCLNIFVSAYIFCELADSEDNQQYNSWSKITTKGSLFRNWNSSCLQVFWCLIESDLTWEKSHRSSNII